MAAETPLVLFVCTGNAARSVMAAALLRSMNPEVRIASAGTHSIPGLPMSTRTRTALEVHDVRDPDHRSAQLEADMADTAALIAVFEPMHVSYMRKKHPDAAAKTASLPRWARDLSAGPLMTLEDRIAALDLASHEFEPWEEVVDPAGGELIDFEVAARDIAELLGALAPKLRT